MVVHSHGREQALPRWGRKARARVARAREILFLRTYIVGRMGEDEEVTNGQVKVVLAFPFGT